MRHTGTLFLSRTPPQASTALCGAFQLQLLLLDRLGPHHTEPWRTTWTGVAAQRFWQTHQAAAARRRPGGGAGACPHPHAGLPPATQRGACARHSLRTGAGAQPRACQCFNAACTPTACDVTRAIDRATRALPLSRVLLFQEV